MGINRGAAAEQLEKTIRPRLKHFETPQDGVRLGKVGLIFEDNLEALMEELKSWFRKVLKI